MQGSDLMEAVKKAFGVAQELKNDPFMIKRPMAETPEIVTPLFQKYEIERVKLDSKTVIGQGQVRGIFMNVLSMLWSMEEAINSRIAYSLEKSTSPSSRSRLMRRKMLR